mgnify:FL=1
MKESATCALCGHGYAYPADLDAKTGMHCASCGALIYAKTGLTVGDAPTSGSLPGPESPAKKTAPLPPVKRKNIPAVSERNPDTRKLVEEILKQLPAEKTDRTVPAASWLAWLLSLACLALASIFPSYGNDSTDPLYMLQWLPSIIFCCTAAILFIQGLAAATRR